MTVGCRYRGTDRSTLIQDQILRQGSRLVFVVLRYPSHEHEYMSRPSPTLEGFRAAFRQPSLALAEITWRWSVGATACTLLGFSFFEYLNTLPVNGRELLFLRPRQPILISRAIAHILCGSLSRVSLAALLGASALTVLWIFAASVGRAITVRALRDHFSERFVPDSAPESAPPTARGEARAPQPSEADGNAIDSPAVRFSERRKRFLPASLLAVNFLRAAITMAAWFALVGASILAGFASTDRNPQPGLAFLFFLPLAPPSGGPQFRPSAPLAANIDREERILSDVPTLAVET